MADHISRLSSEQLGDAQEYVEFIAQNAVSPIEHTLADQAGATLRDSLMAHGIDVREPFTWYIVARTLIATCGIIDDIILEESPPGAKEAHSLYDAVIGKAITDMAPGEFNTT